MKLRFVIAAFLLTCLAYFGFAAVGMGPWSGLRIPIYDYATRQYWFVRMDSATLQITGDATSGYTLKAPGTNPSVALPTWRRDYWVLTAAQISSGVTLAFVPLSAESVLVTQNGIVAREGVHYALNPGAKTIALLTSSWQPEDALEVRYQSQ